MWGTIAVAYLTAITSMLPYGFQSPFSFQHDSSHWCHSPELSSLVEREEWDDLVRKYNSSVVLSRHHCLATFQPPVCLTFQHQGLCLRANTLQTYWHINRKVGTPPGFPFDITAPGFKLPHLSLSSSRPDTNPLQHYTASPNSVKWCPHNNYEQKNFHSKQLLWLSIWMFACIIITQNDDTCIHLKQSKGFPLEIVVVVYFLPLGKVLYRAAVV